jgi:hypothetical protein
MAENHGHKEDLEVQPKTVIAVLQLPALVLGIFFFGSQSGDHRYEDVENMAIIRGKI